MAQYFVGDIQGCFTELERLLEHVEFDAAVDELWLTGDLVARGPESLETLLFIRSLGTAAKTVLGNHDLHLIAVYFGLKKPKTKDLLSPLLSSPEIDDLIFWLRQQPLLRKVNPDVYMAHAGLPPVWTIEQSVKYANFASEIIRSDDCKLYLSQMYENQPDIWRNNLSSTELFRYTVNCFTRMRFCYPDGRLELITKESPDNLASNQLLPWFELHHFNNFEKSVIFGHWASLMGYTNNDKFIALDTGCVWGNHLTMYRLDDNKFFTQKAR